VPVWFRWTDAAFEATRPFRGVAARGVAELVEGDVTSARAAIAGGYLGVEDGERFAADGAPGQGCRSDSCPTVRGGGPCRASCQADQPWTAVVHRPHVWACGLAHLRRACVASASVSDAL
jgi:hypothetical protein